MPWLRLAMKATINTFTSLSWEAELALSYRTADDLVREGLIGAHEKTAYEPLLAKYRFLLPRYYAQLIDRNDPLCPIRKQAIPSLKELKKQASFVPDPLADFEHRPQSKLTHRYSNRVLLHLTSNCSMYCRFCFRKSLLNEHRADFFGGEITEALIYLSEHTEIEEVIFSGGDPFLANGDQLFAVLDKLNQMDHIERIRFHTRVPATFPIRVTEDFASELVRGDKPVIVVNHFNHPKELTDAAAEALYLLRTEGIVLLNQSVLLAGVNDSSDVLAELSRELMMTGTLPYYLHHPDRSAGTGHFDLSMERGVAIWKEMKTKLPGYLVPRYVVDVVGQPYKSDVETLAPKL